MFTLKAVDVLGIKGLRVFYVCCTNLHIVIILCGSGFFSVFEVPRYIDNVLN